ncbi:MAG: hypothetical protein ONB44_25095 [candidate division KSB1 bacterium]|nr:hypothetical protein [candidate division KSB1 bacterium]MDZ7305410.1 hypothetical protein [candidate division KSB1 bacterium]MDZ7314482.1 hypothetical protein [candidate division KSB1 bacterium]
MPFPLDATKQFRGQGGARSLPTVLRRERFGVTHKKADRLRQKFSCDLP